MITFGTSGWRGIIAEEFTFDNVRLVAQAIAEYLKKDAGERSGKQKAVVIGYDTRFLSETFSELSAEVLAANGIKALLCKRDTPTPVISYEILRRRVDGGINFTASHNPPQYNGIKFSPSWGGPALPETTQAIEKYCRELSSAQVKHIPFEEAKRQKLAEYIDPRPPYLKRIKELVNLKAIRKANLKIATDMLNGTATGYLDELLDEAGVRQTVTRNWRDVLFGGHAPEPNEANLKSLASLMKKESSRLGLATDGDGDRFGILDSDGTFINPNQVVSLLLYHLITTRCWSGVCARSVMTTHMIDRIAEKFGVQVMETPVGFKYIGDILVKEGSRFIIGGEESGGLTIRGHVPEKDGILACLLVAEMAAMSKKPLRAILAGIDKLVGPVYSGRVNFHLSEQEMDAFKKKISGRLPDRFGPFAVERVVTLDGYKFILSNGSWLGLRLSGTEPVVRLYLESASPAALKKLTSLGKTFVTGK